ncbi:MAG: hypothetical protein QXX61_03585 [Ignisphaera sp.]
MYKEPCFIVDQSRWLKRREEAYRRFLEDIEIGYADKDIVDFIKHIFAKEKIFTTSSCSGRITIVDALYPWLREESYIVFKKHEPVSVDEIIVVIQQQPLHRLWLISSGPIVHFVAVNLDTAYRILQIARESGFKHSGIISMSIDGIVVEIISGTWTSFLLRDGDVWFTNNIDKIVAVANEVLIEGKKRLEKLFKLFKDADI